MNSDSIRRPDSTQPSALHVHRTHSLSASYTITIASVSSSQ